MKKAGIIVLAILLMSGTAMADSIKGRLGVTGRAGFNVPLSDGEVIGVAPGQPTKITNDTGFAGGGGFIYGITDNVAAELLVTYVQTESHWNGVTLSKSDTEDVSLGLQYRFMPESKIVPYIGAGFDVLVIDSTIQQNPYIPVYKTDTDTVVGGHVRVGADYFVTKRIALNADFASVFAGDAEVKNKNTGAVTAKVSPNSFTGLFGVRVFFN